MFNLKGKLYKHYDEAGLTSIHTYDFKGQVPEKIRRVIKDSELLSVFEGPPVDWGVEAYRVDWETATDSILDTTEYTTSMSYDALGRVTEMVYPEDVSNQRKVLIPSYNRSGALERVQLKESEFGTPITYVDRIAYNARGQKVLTALGNGTMTRFLYREDNFRLLRMKSERYQKYVDGNTVTYEHQSGTTKQNFTYNYDLAGNIISISDTSTGCGIGGSNQLSRSFEYDALYRLLSATGRETAGTAVNPWKDRYRPNDNTVSRAYTQFYGYDKLGNIQELQHVASGGSFTRAFNYISGKNKLDTIGIGTNTFSFAHDVNGNIVQEDANRRMAYDYADRLKAFYIQANTEEPSTYTQYFYDASGNRVKKISRTQGGSSTQTTVYIDGIFEHTVANSSETIPNLEIGPWKIGYGSGEQNVLHIMDDASRIATLRIGDAMGDTTPALKFNLEDHLGSSNLSLDINSSLVSKEEYYPFGETSFGSYGKKRYRFCGKEKDEESGLYYYGARYYNAWTCRFMSLDPMALKNSNQTPYNYCSNNPINRIDPEGMDDTPKDATNASDNPNNIGTIGPPQQLPDGSLKHPDGTVELPEVVIIGEKQVSGAREKFESNRYVEKNTSSNKSYSDSQIDYSEYPSGRRTADIGNFPDLIAASIGGVEVANFKDDLLADIIVDEQMIKYEVEIINELKANPKFGNESFEHYDESGKFIRLGPPNPLPAAETEVTWTMRHALVKYWASVDEKGEITIEYRLDDVLDLKPNNLSGMKEFLYDIITTVTGSFYHGILDANENMQTRAEFTSIIPVEGEEKILEHILMRTK